jgi:hypothetical protein
MSAPADPCGAQARKGEAQAEGGASDGIAAPTRWVRLLVPLCIKNPILFQQAGRLQCRHFCCAGVTVQWAGATIVADILWALVCAACFHSHSTSAERMHRCDAWYSCQECCKVSICAQTVFTIVSQEGDKHLQLRDGLLCALATQRVDLLDQLAQRGTDLRGANQNVAVKRAQLLLHYCTHYSAVTQVRRSANYFYVPLNSSQF